MHKIVIQIIVGRELGGHPEDPSRHEQVECVLCLLPGEVVVKVAVGDTVDPTQETICQLEEATKLTYSSFR